VVHFACHPVIVQAQDLVSGDFVGIVQTRVTQTIDKTKACLFLQGARGDINPIIHDTTDFRDVSAVGMETVKEVARVFAQVQSDKPAAQPVILRVHSRMLSFPSRPLPDKAETPRPRSYGHGEESGEKNCYRRRLRDMLEIGLVLQAQRCDRPVAAE